MHRAQQELAGTANILCAQAEVVEKFFRRWRCSEATLLPSKVAPLKQAAPAHSERQRIDAARTGAGVCAVHERAGFVSLEQLAFDESRHLLVALALSHNGHYWQSPGEHETQRQSSPVAWVQLAAVMGRGAPRSAETSHTTVMNPSHT